MFLFFTWTRVTCLCNLFSFGRAEKEKEEVKMVPIASNFDLRIVAAPPVVFTPSPADTEYKHVSSVTFFLL